MSTTLTSTRCSRSTHSSGNSSKKTVKNSWTPVSGDRRSARSRRESHSFTWGNTWGPARPAISPRLTFSTRPFWAESTSRRACFRTWAWPISSSGSFLGFSWCACFWIGERWCSSYFISSRSWLMSARGPSRSLSLIYLIIFAVSLGLNCCISSGFEFEMEN